MENGERDVGSGERAWDAFVGSHPHGLVYHLSAWAGVIEGAFPHIQAHRIEKRDDEGNLTAALPVFAVRSWLTGNRLVSIPFATLCDPLLNGGNYFPWLLERARDVAKTCGARYIDLRVFRTADQVADADCTPCPGFLHHYIDLDPDPEVIRRRFHRKSVRQTISHAERAGLECRPLQHEADLADFYRYYAETRKQNGLPSQPYRFFAEIRFRLCPSGHAEYLLVQHRDRVVGGLLLLKYKDRVSAEYIGYDPAVRDLHPAHILFWEAIRRASLDGYAVFDFGRTAVSNAGLLEFKRRWGTVESELPSFVYPIAGAPADTSRQDSLGSRCLQSVILHSPRPVAGAISRFCYRHLG